jgi:sigma-B regulation protein RsbU (phosphoserine phosphatase)
MSTQDPKPYRPAEEVVHPQELRREAQVHYSFLPDGFATERLDIAVKARPLNTLGGDYCSIYPLDENCVILCLCDAVGHGIASALFASRINTYVLSHALQKRCPCHLIESLNEHLCQRMASTGMFTSFFSIFLDTRSRRLAYAGAGHPPVIRYRRDRGRCDVLESVTTLLGIYHPLPLRCAVAQAGFRPGDRLVLYTDGLIESRDDAGNEFGLAGLQAFTEAHPELSSRAFSRRLFAAAHCEGGYEIRDDVLLMTVSLG